MSKRSVASTVETRAEFSREQLRQLDGMLTKFAAAAEAEIRRDRCEVPSREIIARTADGRWRQLAIIALLQEGSAFLSDKKTPLFVGGSVWQDEGARRKIWTKAFTEFPAHRARLEITPGKLRKWWTEMERAQPVQYFWTE